MARYLMTHSLLRAWLYALRDNPYEDATTEKDPMEDFMRVLRREPTPTTPAIQNGNDFEDLVTGILTGATTARYHKKEWGADTYEETWPIITEHPWYEAACTVAEFARGGQLQLTARKDITVDGVDLLLYGRLDVLKAGTIYDIKYTSKYERGKFFDSTQHPVYFEIVPETPTFAYLVSDGTNVWTETYYREDSPSIYPTISAFLDWLQATGNMEVYKDKWLAL